MPTRQVIWSSAHNSSICSSYKENAYKVLMFWNHTPDWLHSVYPNVSNGCWRCNKGVGSLYHIFWTCSVIVPFWRQLNKMLSTLISRELTLDPLTHLLGLPIRGIPKPQMRLIIHILTAGKCLISRLWKSSSPPALPDLCNRIREVRTKEYLTARIYDRLDKFQDIWSLWDLSSFNKQ